MQSREFHAIDYEGFTRELNSLKKSVEKELGEDDIRHLRKIEWWGRICSFLGYATSWIVPNPLSALLISQGMITRWTMMMHHVGHRGCDKVPGIPARYTSRVFARGWRRFLDFPDWIETESWLHEHNLLHHYHTGERADPDLVERNLTSLRRMKAPGFVKLFVIAFMAVSWKWAYYCANTLRMVKLARRRPAGADMAEFIGDGLQAQFDSGRKETGFLGAFDPYAGVWREVVTKCLLPYVLFRFVAIPSAFLLISPQAALYALLTTVMAEVFTNIHAFLIIVPNHAGDDLYQFDTTVTDKAEFYVRQVIGSVNYRTGSDGNDFLHGWLNYQIEHHLWPDLPMLRYQQLQPRVKALCEKYGVPYVQEGLMTRVWKLCRIMTGSASQPLAATLPKSVRRPDSVDNEPIIAPRPSVDVPAEVPAVV